MIRTLRLDGNRELDCVEKNAQIVVEPLKEYNLNSPMGGDNRGSKTSLWSSVIVEYLANECWSE